MFIQTNDTVNLIGTLENSDTTLALTATTGSWNVEGTIQGGTVTGTGGAELVLDGGTLDGVTISPGTVVDGTETDYVAATILDGLTLNGTLNLGNGYLLFSGTQTLGGSGTLAFSGPSTPIIYVQDAGGPATLTIGPELTIEGGNGVIGLDSSSDASIVNDGTIDADGSGSSISINLGPAGTFTNEGTLEAIGGATIGVAGAWTNDGTISATDSTLSLGGQAADSTNMWSNAGTITASDSTVNLGGLFTLAAMGMFIQTNDTVNLIGTLENSDTTLALTATTGSWNVEGTIQGGTVTGTGGAELVLDGGTLDGVTIGPGTTVDGTAETDVAATILDGLTLNGTLNLGNPGYLIFSGSQTLGGNGNVVFTASYRQIIIQDTSNPTFVPDATLTIGSGITIEGGTGYINFTTADTSIVNDGTIDADTAGATITVGGTEYGGAANAGTLINNGILEATGGGWRSPSLRQWQSMARVCFRARIPPQLQLAATCSATRRMPASTIRSEHSFSVVPAALPHPRSSSRR